MYVYIACVCVRVYTWAVVYACMYACMYAFPELHNFTSSRTYVFVFVCSANITYTHAQTHIHTQVKVPYEEVDNTRRLKELEDELNFCKYYKKFVYIYKNMCMCLYINVYAT
jgi:hypothetical protein